MKRIPVSILKRVIFFSRGEEDSTFRKMQIRMVWQIEGFFFFFLEGRKNGKCSFASSTNELRCCIRNGTFNASIVSQIFNDRGEALNARNNEE